MGNNIRRLRDKMGWTQAEAAEQAGLPLGTYRKLEYEERGLSTKNPNMKKIAKAYGVSPAALISGVIPVLGYVGAGSEAHFYGQGQGPVDEAPMPANGTLDTVAVEIRGDSLGPFFNRWLVYYDNVRLPPTLDQVGHLCVVGLPDDRVLIKRLARGSRLGLFHLLSQADSPIEDVTVSWAALVKGIVPR